MRLQDVYKLLDEEQDDVSGSEPDPSWYNWVHYLADSEATVAINPVWRDPETCTVVILGSLCGKRHSSEAPIYYHYMSETKMRSRLIFEDRVIHAQIILGKSWRERKNQSSTEFAWEMYWDVQNQVEEREVLGTGDLSHLRAAARLVMKIINHYERKGFQLKLHISGSDTRRAKAYYWLAKKCGVEMTDVEGVEDGNPTFYYQTKV